MNSVCEFSKVSKFYQGAAALKDVSFQVKSGQVVALLGENGAGKTTTIRILLGLQKPDYGQASVLGIESQKHGAEIRRRVGYVPDRPAIYDWMTVLEAGWFAAGFYPLGYFDRYQELIARFQLPKDRPVKALSKGMQAKVSLALAMAHEPGLLILDEPTSGLDPMVRREFLESMVDIAATGRTVFLSSHQIGEVERVADTILVLRKGRLVLNERLETLKSRVQELHVTFRAVESDPPPLAGEARLITAQRYDRRWQLFVRDFMEDDLTALLASPLVVDATLRHPSLEELFLACMQSHEEADWTMELPLEQKSQTSRR